MAKKPDGKTAKKPASKKPPAKKPTVKKLAAKKSGKTAVKPEKTTDRGGQHALHALVIGCDLYLPNSTPEGSYPSLRGCVSDAKRVAEFLCKRAGLTDDRLTLLTSAPSADRPGKPAEPPERLPTYENIVGAFQALTRRAKRGDHVYVHYSGHGGRCPTIVPKVKGARAFDEGLVPIDIGDKKARYVRDVEIAKLLRDMTDKGLLVTAVLDCCHAGGATRAVTRADDPVGVRGVDFEDKTKRPTDSLVGTPEELAGVVPPADATRGPEQTRSLAPADAEKTGCVVLAACRPFELAREFMFDGGPSQGALTYWFLKMIGPGAEGMSFRSVYDHITARIHDQFPAQTPMIFGNPDREILGSGTVATVPTVPVTAATGTTVTLGAGQTSLVERGAEYAVYPPTGGLADPTARVALVRVTDVKANSSTAAVSQPLKPRGVQSGDRAVPVGPPLRLVRKVGVVTPDGKPPAPSSPLGQVVSALSGQVWVEPAGQSGEPADFVVTTKGGFLQICDASDVPIPIRPELPTRSADSPQTLVGRLVHLARFHAIQTLDNSDPTSPLRNRVVVEVLKTPPGFRRGDPTTGLQPYPAGVVPRLKPDEWMVLSVDNRSDRAINVVVLDLASDWSVSIAHPEEPFWPLKPGEPPLHLPLGMSLPPGQTGGHDVLKVIATVDPPSGMETLILPALDQPIPRAAERGGTRSVSPLGALMAAVTADRPTRAASTGGQPLGAWAVGHVRVDIA